MQTPAWDLFTSRRAPSSLWFGYQLAQALAQRGQPVRLFTDELDELSAALPGVEPNRWVQALRGIEIIDLRMADISPVPSVALQMLDTPLPLAYRDRLARQPAPTRCVQVVTHADLDDGLPRPGPLVSIGRDGHCTQWLVQFGDAPEKSGYIKRLRHELAPAAAWGHAASRANLVHSLGLRPDLLADQLTVFFDVRLPYPIAPLLECLAAGPRPVCLLMHPSSLQWAATQTSLPWVHERKALSDALVHGAVTLVELPSRRWSLVDGVITAADLVMTTEGDIAMQASVSGTPVIWSCNDTGFFNWYALDSGPVIRRTLAGIFNAVATAQDVQSAWTLYMARWEEMSALAGRVAQRIRRAPDLADVLLAALGDSSPEAIERQFAPTEPGVVLA